MMNQEIYVISVSNLHKTFRSKVVLNGVNFELPKGQIYALCGSNGSGKSVFLRNIVGLMKPDQGEIRVWGSLVGKDLDFPESTGALIDQAGFIAGESGFANLSLLAEISGKVSPSRVKEAMRFVGLNPNDKKAVKAYSVGMRQRLGIAQAIMEDSELLILDEPTAGLDFEVQKEIYEYLIELKKLGKTILFTSHNQNEIKLLCDKVYLMKNGKLDLWSDILVDQTEREAYGN